MNKPKAFIFWVNKEGSKTPNYILLCLKTIFLHLKAFDMIIVDHNNLEGYLPAVYNIDQLKKLSLPMQSDAISVALLEKYGGIYLDADTILTKNILPNIDITDARLICFGVEKTASIHMSVLISMSPGNLFLRAWREKVALKIANIPPQMNWSYVGGSIFAEIYKEPGMASLVHIKDKFVEGVILETQPSGTRRQDPWGDYLKFYFNYVERLPDELLERVRFGAICLHHSWTPLMYQNASIGDVLDYPCTLSMLLRKLISEAIENELAASF